MRTRVNYFTENSVRIPKTEFSMLGNEFFSLPNRGNSFNSIFYY